jgi:hypothetical protein
MRVANDALKVLEASPRSPPSGRQRSGGGRCRVYGDVAYAGETAIDLAPIRTQRMEGSRSCPVQEVRTSCLQDMA